MAKPNTQVVAGQTSWRLAADGTEVYVTRTGGHVGPARFRLDGRAVEPFSVAPWAEEKLDASTPAMLRTLRGDFFCMPFGGNDTPHRGERHPPHGETAGRAWSVVEAERSRLRLAMETTARPGRVEKTVELRDGQTAIYQRHVIAEMSGPMSYGHHAMLRFPDRQESGLISTSPIRFGRTTPVPFERPEARGYSMLRPDAEFHALDRVPCVTTEMADLSRYPARRGYEDLVMLVNAPAEFAWTAVVFPRERYAWFALKDLRVLPATILWISNGGRHYAPWSGRHVNVMGLEDVCSYFHYGLAESVRSNPISKAGVSTHVKLYPRRPTVIPYIMAVAAVPATFTHVERIEREPAGVALIDRKGRRVRVSVDVEHLIIGSTDPRDSVP